jgi:uncharacterized protein (TIGR02453 family)
MTGYGYGLWPFYDPRMPSPFTPKTLSFLRALKRNNDRDWFRARKEDYERHVRAPLVRVIGQLSVDLPRFAPELMADPTTSLFRIYRDTRFSEDKSPLKTNAAAVFPPRGFPRHGGAGLYFEIAPDWTWIGGGLYMPAPAALYAVRAQIAASHPTLHRIVTGRTFKEVLGELQGDQLTRVPPGFARDHPAVKYLKHKQFLGFRELPAEFACGDDFYPELLRTFRALTPLVRFLNEAIRSGTPATVRTLLEP